MKYVVEGNQLKVYPATRQVSDVNMTIHKHIKSIDKLTLSSNENYSISFFDEKPQVSLLRDGVIMPRSEGLKFPFKAVNVRAVRMKIVHIIEDNVAFFLQRK